MGINTLYKLERDIERQIARGKRVDIGEWMPVCINALSRLVPNSDQVRSRVEERVAKVFSGYDGGMMSSIDYERLEQDIYGLIPEILCSVGKERSRS